MKKKRRVFEVFNLSFLDVVSCGFGAIVLLLVISKISEPEVIENITADLSSSITQLKLDNSALYEKSAGLAIQLKEGRREQQRLEKKVINLQSQYSSLLDE